MYNTWLNALLKQNSFRLSPTPCHRGAMNRGCVVIGRPHPSHHSPSFIPRSMKLLMQSKKQFRWIKFWRMENQYKGVDCLFHRTRAFVWDLNVPRGSLRSYWSSQWREFPFSKLHWKPREPYGKLQNPTRMLSYKWFYDQHTKNWSKKKQHKMK